MSVFFKKCGSGVKGTWKPMWDSKKKKVVEVVFCPSCGNGWSLDGFKIGDEGVVMQQFICASDTCEWREFLVLENWE